MAGLVPKCFMALTDFRTAPQSNNLRVSTSTKNPRTRDFR
ncbi:hypothetical protein HMPREF9104_02261 [Lentilactobacillus kisonensis F0435]|uniref:Uncharacterized protein n=1 Tax=Lentilactobacillus kisonensis F0435 TaxID=797516 RepID=H1LI20_9LACO|nr:hypothetical protein HMPREF9104_02261 [Lentilactobacillus kisonensis F0435]